MCSLLDPSRLGGFRTGEEFVNVKWQGLKSSDNSWEPLSAFMQNHMEFCNQYDMPGQDELDSLQNNTVFIFNLNCKRKKSASYTLRMEKWWRRKWEVGLNREKKPRQLALPRKPPRTLAVRRLRVLQEDQRVTAFVQLQLDRQGRMKASQVGHLGAILTNIMFDMFINQLIYVVFHLFQKLSFRILTYYRFISLSHFIKMN